MCYVTQHLGKVRFLGDLMKLEKERRRRMLVRREFSNEWREYLASTRAYTPHIPDGLGRCAFDATDIADIVVEEPPEPRRRVKAPKPLTERDLKFLGIDVPK